MFRLGIREDLSRVLQQIVALILESENRTRLLFEDVVARIATGRNDQPRT